MVESLGANSATESGTEESAAEKTRIAYDATLRRPACVLLQAALGCDPYLAQRFPTDTWLLAPTPDLRVYAATREELEKLVLITQKNRPEGGYR